MRSAPLLLSLLTACAAQTPVAGDDAALERLPWGWILGGRGLANPESPALMHDVHLTEMGADGNLALTWPVYPALRTTADGRVGINMRGRDGDAEIFLVGPEGLRSPLPGSAPGVHMILDEWRAPTSTFHQSTGSGRHFAICDTTPTNPAPGDVTNPYPCAEDPTHDCYDVTIVSSVEVSSGVTELWGTGLHVEVADPKTAAASLVEVAPATPVFGGSHDLIGILEPTVAEDGRLIVARSDWTRIPVPDPDNPGAQVLRSVNVVYSLPDDPASYDPCDVAQWQEWTPLSHMPHDPAATAYGLSKNEFRDPEFDPIGDWFPLGISYPWIDRRGDNLFFTSGRATFFYDADTDPAVYDIRSRYPWDCVPGATCGVPTNDRFGDPDGLDAYEDQGVTRGVGVVGLWTRGKLVVLDGLLNNTDYGFGREPEDHRLLELYQPGTGPNPSEASGWVRVGTGRDNGDAGLPAPPGTSNNTAVIDSYRQLFFHVPEAHPTTVRDVVWTVNTGKVSAEVAFDDYLDPDALLIVEMVPSFSHVPVGGRNAAYLHDGFSFEPPRGDQGFFDPVHLQNAATPAASRWAAPKFGLGFGGVRVEPVALGGRHGRGLWLFGNRDGVVFDLPEQAVTPVASSDWYVGLFVDPRFDDDARRELLTFPDGSGVALEGLDRLVVLAAGGGLEAVVTLPGGGLVPESWTHLGLSITDSGAHLEVYVDGFLYEEHTMSGGGLQPVEGRLWLGDAPGGPAGFRGWLDELKIIARDMSPELACNHARGTLVALDRGAPPELEDLAAQYPATGHDRIGAALGAPGTEYVCLRSASPAATSDRTEPLPPGTTSVRSALVFPEGPLVFGRSRPDSVDNPFCQSCHVAGNTPTLSTGALAPNRSWTMSEDPRRQPMQPPLRIYGVVPADYAGPGLPATDLVAPEDGELLDQWTFAP